MSIDHVLQALTTRRYLISVWPWRSLAYAVTSLPLLSIVSAAFALLTLPAVAVVQQVVVGRELNTAVLGIAFSGVLLLLTIAPLAGIPLGWLERRRLGIVDKRPVSAGYAPRPNPGCASATPSRRPGARWRTC